VTSPALGRNSQNRFERFCPADDVPQFVRENRSVVITVQPVENGIIADWSSVLEFCGNVVEHLIRDFLGEDGSLTGGEHAIL
jgi:hypothetical protein